MGKGRCGWVPLPAAGSLQQPTPFHAPALNDVGWLEMGHTRKRRNIVTVGVARIFRSPAGRGPHLAARPEHRPSSLPSQPPPPAARHLLPAHPAATNETVAKG